MIESSPPPLPPPPQAKALAHRAAKNSWICSAIIIGVLALGSRSSAKVIIDFLALLFIVAGLVCGVVALLGIPKHGIKGILAPALVGIAINGLLAFIFATNFVAARARARESVNTRSSLGVAKPSVSRADIAKRLCEHIERAGRRTTVMVTNQAETIWSDDVILEVGREFAAPVQELFSRSAQNPKLRAYVERLRTDRVSTRSYATLHRSSSGRNLTEVRSMDGKTTAQVETIYMEYLYHRYPNSTVSIQGEFTPVVIEVAGEFRASVMPIRLQQAAK